MKKLLIAGLLTGFAFAAAAQTSGAVTVKDASNNAVSVTPVTNDSDTAPIDDSDRNCIRRTGSRLLVDSKHSKSTTDKSATSDRDDQCLPVSGRGYSQQDIRRTGAPELSDALRMLDPAVH